MHTFADPIHRALQVAPNKVAVIDGEQRIRSPLTVSVVMYPAAGDTKPHDGDAQAAVSTSGSR